MASCRLEAGVSISEIARMFNITSRTIHNLQRRFDEAEYSRGCPRTGRPRVTTPAVDRYIRVIHLMNRFQNAVYNTAENIPGDMKFDFVFDKLSNKMMQIEPLTYRGRYESFSLCSLFF